MGQVSWRVDDELLDRVRHVARAWGWSVNEYVTRVMEAATDPSYAGEAAEQVRERLSQAGLLAAAGAPRVRPSSAAVAKARRAAARGTSLSEHVRDGRR